MSTGAVHGHQLPQDLQGRQHSRPRQRQLAILGKGKQKIKVAYFPLAYQPENNENYQLAYCLYVQPNSWKSVTI